MSKHYELRRSKRTAHKYILKFSDYIFYTCFIQMFCYSFFFTFYFALKRRVLAFARNDQTLSQWTRVLYIWERWEGRGEAWWKGASAGGMNTRMENEKSTKRSNNKMYGCFVDSNETTPPQTFRGSLNFFCLKFA